MDVYNDTTSRVNNRRGLKAAERLRESIRRRVWVVSFMKVGRLCTMGCRMKSKY
jgi:hypothetical protein